MPFTALVLAGTRPGGDPFAQAMGVPYKAMVPALGVPLLRRVVDALRGSSHIERIVVSGMSETAVRQHPQLAELLDDPRFCLVEGRGTPATSTLDALDSGVLRPPVLLTTGDHALLTTAMIDALCGRAAAGDADVVVGVVDADLVRSRYPGVRRTFTRLRDGTYKGTNLFALLTPASRAAPLLWIQVEQDRKRPWRMVSFLGPIVLLRFLLRRLSLAQAIELVARRMGIRICAELLPFAEAALDVDCEAHLAVAEQILRARQAKPPP